MTRRAALVLIAQLLLIGTSAFAQGPPDPPDEITWLTMEFPPFFIHEGEEAGTGIADGVMSILQEEMDGWSHRQEVASTAQIVLRLRSGEPVCSAAYIRTPERERIMTFSVPDLILPPNGITVRRADLPDFGDGGPVSLASLLENPDLRLAVAKGRSYGGEIDAVLEAHERDPHVYRRLGEDIYASLFRMLLRGGVDYILGYPYEARFHARRLGRDDEIVSLPVSENPEMILAHVVCPRNDWGRRVIAEIDEILERVRPTEEYRALVERWIGPELRDRYREAYEAKLGAPPARPAATDGAPEG